MNAKTAKVLKSSAAKTERMTFDEHIEDLKQKISDNEKFVKECLDEIKSWKKEIKEVEKEKREFLKFQNYKPSIYLDGLKEKNKEKPIIEWCREHELKFHRELVGNYIPEGKFHIAKKAPEYEFVSAHSDTSKLRYVICKDCWIAACKRGKDADFSVLRLED